MNSAVLSAIKREFFLPAFATVLASCVLLLVVIDKVPQPPSQSLPADTPDTESPVTEAITTDPSPISTWHLFGQSPDIPHAGSGETPAIPQELKLRGVFYLGPHYQARAIIESADQTQKTYQVNARLPGGEILIAIGQNNVTLLINNQETTLPLSKFEPSPEALEATPPQ
ncbi:type II secretion system protein N [Methylovulum miyakonense]|uniref:type II secretion system protein N n=1 Tax=Methylovulum miyakonense TaxID=645578 RepID=UPI00037CE029|nr:type II secretion system protein N [Methylovulum miyakonense]